MCTEILTFIMMPKPPQGRMLSLHPKAISHPGTLTGISPLPKQGLSPSTPSFKPPRRQDGTIPGCSAPSQAHQEPGHFQAPPAIRPLPPRPCSEAQEQMQKPRGLKGCCSTARCRSCHSSHSELQGIRAPCCRVSVQQQSR